MALARTAVAAVVAVISATAMAMLSPRALAPALPSTVDAGALDASTPAAGLQGAPGTRTEAEAAPPPVVESPEVVALRAAVADPAAAPGDRTRAAFALAAQVGPAAVADIAPLLQDDREAIRIGAARGLAQAGGDDAKKALEDRLELEEEPVVREAIQRTLTLMQP